jgi:hypothetical protein
MANPAYMPIVIKRGYDNAKLVRIAFRVLVLLDVNMSAHAL